ncbi:MAG TPA: trypsin-like peptidase domain-containing protein [Acidobacteriota bacterium]|nr:trypsin-like peptidase domain-containing protein [Acidobacteriota bacterium]
MNRHPFRIVVITALLTFAATIVALRWDVVPGYSRRGRSGSEAALAAAPKGQPPLSPEEETNIRVYGRASPGVVNITSTVVEYGFFFSPIPKPQTGSGVVLDLDGNILTNYHVIESAQSLEVALPDMTKYRAKTVGFDKQNDIAVIRLVGASKDRLHPVPMGDSDSLKVGQKVLAIGNPFRLQNTLTVGIISSLGRRIQTESGDLVENVIQTDAAINPGNSGGPLLNTAGEMIGINTSIFTLSGGNMGIGFAIPANTIRRVVIDLLKEGRVVRPWLGVDGYSITDDLASALDLPVSSGVLVAKVYRGSSADEAGIHGASEVALLYMERILIGGDIITAVDGKPVNSIEELNLALEPKRPGDTVQITLYRGKSKMQKAVRLNEAPRQRGRL